MRVEELDTPALCVDLDVLEKNISDLQSACNALDIPLRVHTKTHKTPAIAQMQIRAGAIGIVSQKIGEAAAMAARHAAGWARWSAAGNRAGQAAEGRDRPRCRHNPL